MSKVLEFFTNSDMATLTLGALVRASNVANVSMVLTSGDNVGVHGILGVVTSSVPVGQIGAVAANGNEKVLLEANLTGLAPNQTLWTSANSGGRATNVKPQSVGFSPVPIGIIIDPSGYIADGSVPITAELQISALATNVSVDHTEEPYINNSGGTITLGTPVQMTNDNVINKASASNAGAAQGTIGVMGLDAPTAGEGPVITSGRAVVNMEAGLAAPAPAAGQTIWLSPNGFFCTNVKPTTPTQAIVAMGIITDSTTYGGSQQVTATLKIPSEISVA